MLSRFPSSKSIAQTARQLAGQPTRLKIGAAAATLAAAAGVAAGAVGAAPAHAAVRTTLASVSTTSAINEAGDLVSSARVPGQVLAGPVLTGRSQAAQQALSQAGGTTASPLAPASAASTTRQTPLAPASKASTPAVVSTPGTQHSSASPQSSAAPATSQPAQSQPAQHQASSTPQQPYLFYDSVTPNEIPSGNIVATYADGPFAVQPSQVSGAKWVLWIDVNGSDPNAEVLDVEPGDATPSTAASWAQARLTLHPNGYAVVYTMLSEWPAVQQAIGTLPQSMQSHVRYWIADPTGVPHVVPGASATQWDWGQDYDISTALPNF